MDSICCALNAWPYISRTTLSSTSGYVAKSCKSSSLNLSDLEQCAQINVVGGGNGTPGPTIKVPGGYKVSCAILAYLNPITHQVMYNRQETPVFSSILMEAASLHIKCPDPKYGLVSLASICCFVGNGEYYCSDKTIQKSAMNLYCALSYEGSTIIMHLRLE